VNDDGLFRVYPIRPTSDPDSSLSSPSPFLPNSPSSRRSLPALLYALTPGASMPPPLKIFRQLTSHSSRLILLDVLRFKDHRTISPFDLLSLSVHGIACLPVSNRLHLPYCLCARCHVYRYYLFSFSPSFSAIFSYSPRKSCCRACSFAPCSHLPHTIHFGLDLGSDRTKLLAQYKQFRSARREPVIDGLSFLV